MLNTGFAIKSSEGYTRMLLDCHSVPIYVNLRCGNSEAWLPRMLKYLNYVIGMAHPFILCQEIKKTPSFEPALWFMDFNLDWKIQYFKTTKPKNSAFLQNFMAQTPVKETSVDHHWQYMGHYDIVSELSKLLIPRKMKEKGVSSACKRGLLYLMVSSIKLLF